MARSKNAKRGHFVAEITESEDEVTKVTDWLPLAKYIETIDPDNSEETDETGFYDGDGTSTTDVTGKAVGYSFAGHYDPEDAAQTLIASKEFATGDDTKIWHKRVSSDGATELGGKATVTGIVVGGGDAVSYEAFECNIKWDEKPVDPTAEV